MSTSSATERMEEAKKKTKMMGEKLLFRFLPGRSSKKSAGNDGLLSSFIFSVKNRKQ